MRNAVFAAGVGIALLTGIVAPVGAVASPALAAGNSHLKPATRTWDLAGDSNTVGLSHATKNRSALEVGLDSHRAYAFWVGEETVLDLSTSYAIGGKDTGDMRVHAEPTTSDLAVIMGGTNDIRHGISQSKSMRNIEAWAEIKNAPRTLVLAIPPFTRESSKAKRYNTALKKLVAQHSDEHWVYSDPWAAMRDSTNKGKWARNCALKDGVHASRGGYKKLGLTIGIRIGKLLGTDYSDIPAPESMSCEWALSPGH